MASTGIAALLLQDGGTSHSTLNIPLHLDDLSICQFSAQDDLALLLKKVYYL